MASGLTRDSKFCETRVRRALYKAKELNALNSLVYLSNPRHFRYFLRANLIFMQIDGDKAIATARKVGNSITVV